MQHVSQEKQCVGGWKVEEVHGVCQQKQWVKEVCSIVSLRVKRVGLRCLMTLCLSKDIRCHVWKYYSKLANHQIRHQATHKVGYLPGDCIRSFWPSSVVCVGVYGLTYSLYRPKGKGEKKLVLQKYLYYDNLFGICGHIQLSAKVPMSQWSIQQWSSTEYHRPQNAKHRKCCLHNCSHLWCHLAQPRVVTSHNHKLTFHIQVYNT